MDERSYIRRLLITLGIVLLTLLLWQLRFVLLLVFAAALVAVIIRSLANPLMRWTNLPKGVALGVTVLALAAALGGAVWLFGAEAAAQFRTLTEALPEAWRAVEERVRATVLGEQLRDNLASLAPDGASIISGVRSVIMALGNGIAGFLLALIGGIYLAFAPGFYMAGLLELFPKERREIVRDAVLKSGHALRLWLFGQIVAMLIVGVVTGVGLSLIGVPSALALGLLVGLAEFVPFLGPIFAAIPALLIAFNQGSQAALLTLALFVVVQQIEGYVVTPLVQQKVATLPAAVTLFAIVAAGVLFGIAGVVLAAPLTVVLYVLVKQLYVRQALHTPTPVPGDDAARE